MRIGANASFTKKGHAKPAQLGSPYMQKHHLIDRAEASPSAHPTNSIIELHIDAGDLQFTASEQIRLVASAFGTEAVEPIVLEFVQAFQTDAAGANHVHNQLGTFAHRSFAECLECKLERIRDGLRHLADRQGDADDPIGARLLSRPLGNIQHAGYDTHLMHAASLSRESIDVALRLTAQLGIHFGFLLLLTFDAPRQHNSGQKQTELI